jgi:uncharacterized protein YpbB
VGDWIVGTYLSFLILYSLKKINGERTAYSIYHLLKGKKSSQTIQDAHLFQLTNLFQTFQQLSRIYFDEIILDLAKKNFIQKVEGEKYKITMKGMTQLDNVMEKMPIPQYLNGWKYHSIQEDFWKRASLLIQVCSNLINFETSYIPIHNEIKTSEWVKTSLLKLSKKREDLADELLQETIRSMSGAADLRPEVIVLRLTGYKQIGLTPIQAADTLEMDSTYFQLEFLNTLHWMIEEIVTNVSDYPILQYLLIDFNKPLNLTKSTSITNRYLQLGKSIEEIAVVRNLKISTIEDHVVEIALNDSSLLLEPFVSLEAECSIRNAIEKLSSKQLKMIRHELEGSVSYFQIRLVLAKIGEHL